VTGAARQRRPPLGVAIGTGSLITAVEADTSLDRQLGLVALLFVPRMTQVESSQFCIRNRSSRRRSARGR